MFKRSSSWGYSVYPETRAIWVAKKSLRHDMALLPLDAISPTVAGCIWDAKLWSELDILRDTSGWNPDWVVVFRNTYAPKSITDWCGWKGTGLGSLATTDAKFKPHLYELMGTVFEKLDGLNAENRFVLQYLETEKANKQVNRVLLNCKPLNAHMGKTPWLSFPTTADLFAIMSFFRCPCFAGADFRHWFYQMKLPACARKLFTVLCEEFIGQFKVWPMGFKWAPFMAQCLSMIMAKFAIEASGFTAKSPVEETVIPPFWIIMKNGTPVGFFVFWYDNALIVTGSTFVRDRIVEAMITVATTINAQWKLEKGQSEPFVKSTGSCQYIGIQFKCINHGVTWSHVEDNANRWSLLTGADTHSWRHASEMIGVIIWNWTVSGLRRSAIEEILVITQKIGALLLERNQWDNPATLRVEEWSLLKEQINEIVAQGFLARVVPDVPVSSQVILLATDAMKIKGAAVRFSADGIELDHLEWDLDELLHINHKETDTARLGVDWVATEFPNSEIRLAVDNTTAAVALSKFVFTSDKELQTKLEETEQTLVTQHCYLIVVQVPGIDQGADERSRGNVSAPDRLRRCGKYLLEFRSNDWFRNLRIRQRNQVDESTCHFLSD